MIKYLTGFFCLMLSYGAMGQSAANYNYTIGLRAYTLMQMPKNLSQTNSQKQYHAFANGILVKFNDNQIAYRFSGYYFYKGNEQFENKCETCESAEGKLTDYAVKIGFEKSLNYAHIQPYLGLELGYRANIFTGELKPLSPASTGYSVDRTKTGIVIAPILGIKFNLTEQFTLFAESSLDFFYSYERRETISKASNTQTTSFSKYTRLEYLINPVSVGLQFHFGEKN